MLNLRQIIFNLPYSVIVVNRQRRVVLSNKAAQEISGLSERSMTNKRGGDVLGCVHAQEHEKGCGYSDACKWCEVKNAVVRCFEDRADIESFEMKLDSQSAGVRHLKIAVSFILSDEDASGEHEAQDLAIVSVDDLTDYKAKEKAAAALETIGAICHELNQPLTVGLGQLALLKLELGENKRIEILSKEFQRMGAITTRLMNLNSYRTKNYIDDLEILDIFKSSDAGAVITKDGVVEAIVDIKVPSQDVYESEKSMEPDGKSRVRKFFFDIKEDI